MADITPARKLFDLLISRDFDPEMLDSSGKAAPDPAEAEIFSFDFRAESGKDYGTVVVMLGDDHDLEVYCADNVGRGMEGEDKTNWFDFLAQLKNFATRNFMDFGIKNLNRLRYSMQGQAAIKEGLFESWSGNRTTSWNGAPTEARLMIRHKKNIGEGDARFRYIESLFIETADSERYKLPFKSLTGGKAMLEHVRQGGRPYDARGNHISEMITELAVISRFRRANQGQIFEGDTAQLVEQVQEYQANLQHSLKGLGTKNGYTTYFESWKPEDLSEQDVVIESLKNLFVKQSIDTRIESALPLLAKIQQQGTAMKEANIFEAWADRLVEGTWSTPDTPEKQAQLLELMSTDLPVGADATNATEQLYDLLGDDELFDQLQALAEQDANADARQVVFDRMQELSDDPDVRRVIEQLNIDPTAEMNPAEPTNPDDLEPQEPVQESDLEDCDSIGGDESDSFIRDVSKQQRDLDEDSLKSIRRAAGLLTEEELKENRMLDETGETIDHILNRFKHEVKTFEQGGELDDDLYHALFDYWNDAGEIPYGVQKARDGDPYEWVAQNLESHLSGGGIMGGNPDEDYGIERESVMRGDYAEEAREPHSVDGGMDNPLIQDEGWKAGALGAGLGALAAGPIGAVIGGGLGGSIEENNKEKNRMRELAGITELAGDGVNANGWQKLAGSRKLPSSAEMADAIASRMDKGVEVIKAADTAGSVGGFGGSMPGKFGSLADMIAVHEEGKEEKKNSSSILPAVAAGAAGAGLGYMAGKAASGSSTKAPTSSSSSTTGSDRYGSWGAPGAPTATGKGLGIDPPAAGSPADIALTGMLENEVDETVDPKVAAAAQDGAFSGLNAAVQSAGLPDMNPVTGGIKSVAKTAGQIAGVPGMASKSFQSGKQSMTAEDDVDEGELGTAIGAGLGGAVGGLGGAALGGIAGHYLTKDKEVKKESDDLDRMSDLAGIKKKVADESLLAPLVGAVGGAALGGELASGIGSKFGSEVGGSIGQAAGQEQAGKLGALVGGMKGSSAGAAAGGEAAKKFGQIAGGIAGLAGGAAIDQAKKSNDDEETNEGSNKKSGSSILPVVAAGAAGAGLGYMASKMGKTPTIPPTPAEIASGTNPMGDIAGSIFEKDNEETDEGWKGQLAGGLVGTVGGGMAGAALGGPIGAMIGSAAGGGAGGLLGNKLGGEEETDEGVRGALAGGAVGGYATRSIKGVVAGAKLGSAIQDRFAKKDDTSPLAGQYGHSGKMKEVSEDTSFLDRLKELSGIKRN